MISMIGGNNDWYHWLINHIPDKIRKSVGGIKDKIVSLFNTNKPEQTVYQSERN